MIVREARLDDVREIVEVYITNPDREFARPVEDMCIAERYGYGGPWMSVESCAIHMNSMLAWGYPPLVVEDRGRVIAETEFYVGRDVPPLSKTLDISVLYVHRDHQRRGAGSLLVEEMVSRAREAGCDHITISGCSPSQGFYERFGFRHLLDLSTINCQLSRDRSQPDHQGYVPMDFEPPPPGALWIGRFLSPTQKWREIHDCVKRREPILGDRIGLPQPVGIRTLHEGQGYTTGFVVPEWGDTKKADAYLWSEALEVTAIEPSMTQILALASNAGYDQLCLLCHPRAERTVARVTGLQPRRSWAIHGKPL